MQNLSSQERLRLDEVALRAISQGVVIAGADRRIVFVNAAFEAITGFSKPEVAGCKCDFLQGPLTDQQSIEKIRQALNDGVEFFGEIRNYRKSGQTFWNELTITPAFDGKGEISHFIGVCRDVTDRVNAREELRERELIALRKSNELEMVLGSMNQGISAFDRNTRLTVWNAQFADMFSIDPSSLKAGVSFLELVEQHNLRDALGIDPQDLQATILKCTSAGEQFRVTTRLASGRIVNSINAPGSDGGWVCTHEDVTEQFQKSENLSKTTWHLTTALASMRQGLAMFDADRHLVVWNQQYSDLLGIPESDLTIGMSLREILVARIRAGSFCGDIDEAIVRETKALESTNSYEILDRSADGRLLLAFVKGLEGGGYVVTHEDVTDQRRIEAQIEHDALHDALTGLPNRRFLDRWMAGRVAVCRATNRGVAVLHLDLDRFKHINDTLGHEAGDAMLIHAASVLKSTLRDVDFVSRVGGDEFVVACALGKNAKHLSRLADRIVKQMRKPVMYNEHECRFGVSIGIAHQSGLDIDAKKLLINADIALYQAKRNGRGCHQFFTPRMQEVLTTTKRLADDMHCGLDRGEFIPFYQPQFDAQTREICGVEALVRWRHPSRGLLTPDIFLKIADEMGVVATIDGMVLEQTIDSLRTWHARGLVVPRASVNVSAKRLRDPGLIKAIKRLALVPGTISFELLESIYLDETDDIVEWNIDQIRELGIDIEIDDFGSGHTSILSLLKLKPQRLKIDRQLVAPIINSASQKKLLRTIVEIGHSLDIKVIAEGVETLEHAAIAASLGCNELQGYAFSRPLSAEDFERFVVAHQERSLSESSMRNVCTAPDALSLVI